MAATLVLRRPDDKVNFPEFSVTVGLHSEIVVASTDGL